MNMAREYKLVGARGGHYNMGKDTNFKAKGYAKTKLSREVKNKDALEQHTNWGYKVQRSRES